MTEASSSTMSTINLYEAINFEGIDDDLAAFQEDEMVQQALQRGVDLKKYGRELETELKKAEDDTVAKYIENSPKFIALYGEMQECDRVLGRMEEMLHGFQADLGEISAEIKHLQEDSLSMSVKLKNRRAVEDSLYQFLEKANISPSIAQNINSPVVNDGFLEAVVTLSKRLAYLGQSDPARDGSSLDIAPMDTGCGRSLLPELEKLKIKAIAKIKDYFTQQFSNMRKPKTNTQMLQQTALVRYAGLFHFVQREMLVVADDLRALYVETMGKTVFNLFKSYYSQLVKLEQVFATKGDLIVIEEVSIKSIFSTKVDMTKRNDSFAMGERDKILEQVEREPILMHVAVAEGQKIPYEAILRSTLKHLIDAATNEFLFVIDFFRTSPKDTFNRIYGKTIAMLLENLENYLLQCFDAVGILIMIRMTYLLRLVMQRRRIPILDPLFDRISLLLWPRFKQIFDSNVKSLKGAQVKKLGVIDLTPHYVSRRYAELISSVIMMHMQQQQQQQQLQAATSIADQFAQSLSPQALEMTGGDPMGVTGGGEMMLQQDILLCRNEMIALLQRMAQIFSNVKDQRVFFINNYDMILNIFQERRLLSEEVQRFEGLLMQQRELFAEEEIKTFFPRLIAFVQQSEQAFNNAALGAESKPSLDESTCEALVRDFATNWRTGIQQINDDVLAYFANFRNGMEILKQVLTQLLLYYTRFQDLIKKAFPRPPAFNRDVVSTATILMEIKRYSRTF